MKKIRILALILALLMLPLSILVGCKKPGDGDSTDPSECRHKWTKYTEISARDCVTPLVRERTCTKCGEKDVDTRAAYGHTLTVAISDNNASCTADGTKTRKCSRCDYSETVADVGSALGHTFPDSRYTVVEGDEFVESAVCVKCEAATDYRLLGLNIDFEGDKNHLSYTKFDEYFVEGAGSVETKTEGEGEDTNSYLAITRDDSVFAGNSAFGVILTPRADMLKGTTAEASPYYVVEFDVRISKTETKDLVLLSGTKKGVTENFIKYNSEDGTLVTAAGTVYSFEDEDYDRWIKISVVLNDGSKEYTVYVDGYQLTFDVDGEVATEISYVTVDGYYLGYDLENLKIGLTAEVGVASKFDIDNIQHYLGSQPKGYKGPADAEYFIYTTANGDKIVYKIADENCAHAWGDTTVVPHTCVSTGYSIHTCSVCGGQEIFDISTDTLGAHDFKEIATIPATCTESAFTQEQCTKCGIKNGKVVGSALGHEIDREALGTVVKPATCTDRGYTVGSCIRCNIEYKVDYTPALGHEIDMEDTDSYEIVPADCLNGGYTIGKCKRCDVKDYITDEKEALGHLLDTSAEDYVKVEVDCVTMGYEESTCGREGCDVVYRTNEVKAFGHALVSEIKEVPVDGSTTGETKRVISSKCTRCADADSQRDLSTKIPNHTELADLIGEANMLGDSGAARLHHYDTLIGSIYGDDTKGSGGGIGFTARYSKYVVKTDMYNSNAGYNGYMEWTYSPQNGKGVLDSNDKQVSQHSYFDYAVQKNADGIQQTEMGRDVTFEISLRVPDGLTENIPLSINVMDRSKMHIDSNHDVTFLNVSKTGLVYLASGYPIAQLTQQQWTRLAFVFHTTNATYDVYVDGVMIEKNVMIEVSPNSDASKASVKPNQLAFEVINYGFRVNAGDQGASVTRKIDVDEVYAYYASVPAYVTDVKLTEKSGMSAFTTDMNSTDDNGAYLAVTALSDASVQRFTHIVAKKNTRFFVDAANGNALHLIKNSSVVTVPDSPGPTQTDSFIDVYVAHNTRTEIPELTKTYDQYKTLVFETEFTINAGTGDFTILNARKCSSYNYQLLQYKGGNIVSGSDVIVEGVEIGRKYTVAVVFRDDAFNYDIYIDGYLMRERVPYVAEYQIENLNDAVFFRIFNTANDADILIHSVNVYGGKETPLYNIGRASFVKVDGNFVTNALVFTEDYDYTVHYSKDTKVNGLYVYDSGKSALSIISGLEKAENDLNLGLIKVDKDGKTGDEAVNEPVWALKTGNWGAGNCTTTSGEASPIKFYPMNVPMNGNYYDFSAYESITFKYYVAESAGYKFLITMGCPKTDNKNCYYTYYVTIPAGTTGWQELTVRFDEFGKNNTVALNKIENINFNFSGWKDSGLGTPSENTPGKAGNGTTLYIAGIDLNSKTTEKMVGMYIEGSDTFCGEGNHIMGETVTVDPSAHVDGYSYKACTAEGCGYVELVEEFEGTALGHVVSGDPSDASVDATCGDDGKLIYDISCDGCNATVIGGKTYKVQHKWVKLEGDGMSKAPDCDEAGYDTYACESGCGATGVKLVLPATGHTRDESVEVEVVEADCVNGGYKKAHCSVCDQDYIYDEEDPLGHTRDAEVLDEGGCEEDRVVKYTCQRCDWEEIVRTAGPGHNWNPWQTITPATCGDGLEKRTCKDCTHFEENVLEGTGAHDYDIATTPADCGNNGERVWTCNVCGDTKTDILYATGDHNYGTEVLTKDPSATEEGYTYNECSVCGRHKVLSTIPAEYVGTAGLKFDITGDTAIIGKYTGTDTEIVIPSTYAGKPVVVSKNAFVGNTSITSVTLGDGVTVAQGAFKGCTALETVVLGEGMTTIATSTFEGCASLKTIVIPSSVTAIDMFAFKDCDALTTVNYAGATKLVAGGSIKANGNDKLFAANWNCNYEA